MDYDIDSLVERWTREQKERIAAARKADSSAEALAKADSPRLLNSLLAGALREVGHTQMVLLADKGFPIPPGVETIDLALTDDVPTILDVIGAIAADLSFDRILITDEIKELSPGRSKALEALGKPLEVFPHIEFKHIAAHARLAVRARL